MQQLNNLNDVKFDEQFSNLKNLKWTPYIGKNYSNSKSKILIIGESHYVPDGDSFEDYSDQEWTRHFIAKEGLQEKPWYNDSQKNNLVREVEKTIVGTKNLSNLITSKFWESVSYYNFVQRLLTSRDNRPTYNDLIMGWEVTFDLCKIIQPDVILFCGVESAKHFQFIYDKQNDFKSDGISTLNVKLNGGYPRSLILEFNAKQTICLFIKHPSSRYSWEPWSNLLLEIANKKLVEFRKSLVLK